MAAKARRVEETRWVQERTEVDKARRVAAAAAANKEVGETAASRGSGPKNVIFLNGPNFLSECSKLLY